MVLGVTMTDELYLIGTDTTDGRESHRTGAPEEAESYRPKDITRELGFKWEEAHVY